MFDVAVAWYLFMGGAGSGSLLAAFALDGFLLKAGLKERWARSAVLSCLIAGFVLVAIGSLFLLADLGRPERIVYVFLFPHESVMSFGAFSITLLLIASFAQIIVRVVPGAKIPAAAFSILRWLCALLSLSVLLYAGFLLKSWGGVEFWGSLFLPALFAVSGASCGASILQMSCWVMHGGRIDLPNWLVGRVLSIDFALIVIEAFLLSGYLVQMCYDAEAFLSVMALVNGRFALCFWVGVVAVGVIMPLAADLLHRWTGGVALRGCSVFGVLAGSFCLRYCILFAAFS